LITRKKKRKKKSIPLKSLLININILKIAYYQLFPRTIGQIVDKYHVKEFHITFTRGSWNDYQWGLNSLPAPAGVEFYAYFDANYK